MADPQNIIEVTEEIISIIQVSQGPKGDKGDQGDPGAGFEDGEMHFTPKVSSLGSEGTMFYASDDDHIWVATE